MKNGAIDFTGNGETTLAASKTLWLDTRTHSSRYGQQKLARKRSSPCHGHLRITPSDLAVLGSTQTIVPAPYLAG